MKSDDTYSLRRQVEKWFGSTQPISIRVSRVECTFARGLSRNCTAPAANVKPAAQRKLPLEDRRAAQTGQPVTLSTSTESLLRGLKIRALRACAHRSPPQAGRVGGSSRTVCFWRCPVEQPLA